MVKLNPSMSSYWIETLGCAKNDVDSAKLGIRARSLGMQAASNLEGADVIVVNTCAFIDMAKQESISVILDALHAKSRRAKLVVTGCMAQRYGDELRSAIPEVDLVVGFGEEYLPQFIDQKELNSSVSVSMSGVRRRPKGLTLPKVKTSSLDFDLLNLPVEKASGPFAYLKIAEGCNRKCGFCAIPSFRGPQRSRDFEDLIAEAKVLDAPELVVIAQDLASYGTDNYGRRRLTELFSALNEISEWVRLLYIFPSQLNSQLIDLIGQSPVSYFDLSLQHVSQSLLRRMRRPGSAESVLAKIYKIRELYPSSIFRTNFIIGYPGETEDDHEELLAFIAEAKLDWVGFFEYSNEDGTYASSLKDHVPTEIMHDRMLDAIELADSITRSKRLLQVGRQLRVLVQSKGIARSYMEAPDIDGVIKVPNGLSVGEFYDVVIDDCNDLDLVASVAKGGNA